MLGTKSSEVNLRNALDAGNKTYKQGIHFLKLAKHHQESKREVSVTPQKDLRIIFKKKKKIENLPR